MYVGLEAPEGVGAGAAEEGAGAAYALDICSGADEAAGDEGPGEELAEDGSDVWEDDAREDLHDVGVSVQDGAYS